MNRHVNAIAGRLSLRPPQRHALEILDRITEIAPPKKGADVAAALAAIRSEFPGVTDFERDFPSLCFALATGVGKTRLMGAFICVPAPGARHRQLLRARAEPHDLRQADRGLHAEHAEVRLQGHRRVRDRRARDHHRRQLRAARRRPRAACFGNVRGQHLQHLEDQLRGARREAAAYQAALASTSARATSTTSPRFPIS